MFKTLTTVGIRRAFVDPVIAEVVVLSLPLNYTHTVRTMATTTTSSTTASTTPTTTPGMRTALVLPASSTGIGSTEVVIATLVASTRLIDMELAAGEDGQG